MRTNIAIVRDHSGSMGPLRMAALKDYNSLVSELKESSRGVGTSYLSVVECNGAAIQREYNVALEDVLPIANYYVQGNTPLYDSVVKAIDSLSPYDGAGVANLVLVITDGEENASKINAAHLRQRIVALQNTDRWTFTFRVPKGYGNKLIAALGLHAGNVIEWEQTEQALEQSSYATTRATKSYFRARSTGKTSVNTFYANPADVSNLGVLDDVSSKFKRHTIQQYQDGISIQDFCIEKIGQYKLGHVYYSLNKAERVQPNKDIIIRDTVNGTMYAGNKARNLLGLPTIGEIKLAPGNMGAYEVYVRSTSNNRKLYANNNVLVKA